MKLAKFIAWTIRENSWLGGTLDGGEVQDKAVEMGILVKTKYDPKIHGGTDWGAVQGCPWFVFSDEFNATLTK